MVLLLSLSLVSAVAGTAGPSAPGMIDLSRAVVEAPRYLTAREKLAVRMLIEEVEKRTRIRWPVVVSAGPEAPAVISISRGARAPVEGSRAWDRPEGLLVSSRIMGRQARIAIHGRDTRGLFYGVGRFLRKLETGRDAAAFPSGLDIRTSPAMPLRGHQLGYRPKTNSYDAWTLPMWEQYYRDLILFGANAVELIPPRSDDDSDSPHFPLPPMEMMVEMSRLADRYGLDVWVWHPALDRDYADSATVEASLQEWAEVYRRLPRVDAVFVPGGDPGRTPPKTLMPFLARQIAGIRRFHPRAQMWVSPQGFTQAWMDDFLRILREESPAWLRGVVFGPQVRMPLPELRAAVPMQYAIRHYPDITHTMQCQFPVESWHVAYALTEGREPINPRPLAMAAICRYHQPHTIGSITYSEGCNDDVNKAVWSAIEWDPRANVRETLREYSRVFVSSRFAHRFAEGLLALERNWQRAPLGDPHIAGTLAAFQQMEAEASPQERLNWRFQQALYRAYYDAFLNERFPREQADERRALEALGKAGETGAEESLRRAEAALAGSNPSARESSLRARVFELAEALFQSIRMQLSVPRYRAIAVWRGANLDSIDHPLNSAAWLRRQLEGVRLLPDEASRRARLQQLARWTDPGPGGFYDDLGDPARRPRLLVGPAFEEDPGHMRSARIGFEEDDVEKLEWARFAETLYDSPLRMRYTGLSPEARYRLRVVYGPNNPQIRVRLSTGAGPLIHDWLQKPAPNRPLEFDVPQAAVSGGTLELVWVREPGLGGNGRGCQVSEVWLLRLDR